MSDLDFLSESEASSPRVRPVRPKKAGIPAWVVASAVGGVVVLLLLVVGLGVYMAGTPGKAPFSADQEAVRRYWRENLDNPAVEEVRWWPARNADAARKKVLDGYQKEMDDLRAESESWTVERVARNYPLGRSDEERMREAPEGLRATRASFDEEIRKVKAKAEEFSKQPPLRVLRVKYRNNGNLEDKYYQIKGGVASPAPGWAYSEADFPD